MNDRTAPATTHATPTHSPNPSGITGPIWYDGVELPATHPLRGDARAEVCIVGAGIAGLISAWLFDRAGKRVIVVDEKPIGGGESGRTSAHLASAIDDRFRHIENTHGESAARILYQSHAEAIDLIELIAREESIDCEFARLDGYLFVAEGQDPAELNEELAAAQRAGFPGVERFERPPTLGVVPRPCLRFPNQARFHPLRFLAGLARALMARGVQIYGGTRITDLSGNGPVTATAYGATITCEHGIAATNIPTPINNWVGVYTKQASYRTYVVGLEIPPRAVDDALYWDDADPYHYVRLAAYGRAAIPILIVGGEDHKTGQEGPDYTERFHRLEDWARRNFPAAGETLFRWSGQVNEPEDGIAFIGRIPTSDHKACYVITGDSGMGLTHGALGAIIVTSQILGKHNPWADLYDPARKPTRVLGEFLKENLNAAAQFTDYLTPGEVRSAADIAPGSGALVRRGVTKLAVYRDPAGTLHACSAVCPHVGCIVHWNQTEQSWDCPCHGSRFSAEGRLINGPAVSDLRPEESPPGE